MRIAQLRLKPTHKISDEVSISVNPLTKQPVFEVDIDCKNFPHNTTSEDLFTRQEFEEISPEEYETRVRRWHEEQVQKKHCHIFMFEPRLYCFCDES